MDSGAWRGFPFDWYPPAPVLVFRFPPVLAAPQHSLPIGDQWLYEPATPTIRLEAPIDWRANPARRGPSTLPCSVPIGATAGLTGEANN